MNILSQWTYDNEAKPVRTPSLGPSTPISNAVVIFITQDRMVKIAHHRNYSLIMSTLECSLEQPQDCWEGGTLTNTCLIPDPSVWRRCILAAVGTGYGGEQFDS